MADCDRELDVREVSCPLPLLKTKQALSQMSSGQTLKVQATDPASLRDFASFARISGHELVATEEESGVYTYTLRHK